jgi:hypothetical protein
MAGGVAQGEGPEFVPQYHKKHTAYCSQFWRLGSLRSRPSQIQCLVKACMLLIDVPSCCVLTGQKAKGQKGLE